MDAAALAALMAKISNVMSVADELEELEPFEFNRELKGEVDDGRSLPTAGQVLAGKGALPASRVVLKGNIRAGVSKEAWGAKVKGEADRNQPKGSQAPAVPSKPVSD